MIGIKVHIERMNVLAHVPMVGMIGQDHDLLEVEVMVEVIGRTVMMTVVMREVRGEGIVMINVNMSTILWYA